MCFLFNVSLLDFTKVWVGVIFEGVGVNRSCVFVGLNNGWPEADHLNWHILLKKMWIDIERLGFRHTHTFFRIEKDDFQVPALCLWNVSGRIPLFNLCEKSARHCVGTYETCPKSLKGTQSIETRHSTGSRNHTPKKSHPNINCKNTSNTTYTTYNQQTFCCFEGIPWYNLLWVGHSLQQRLQTLKALPPEQLKQIIDELGAQRIPEKNRRMSHSLGW